jgi:hypothetical protein
MGTEWLGWSGRGSAGLGLASTTREPGFSAPKSGSFIVQPLTLAVLVDKI